jgi:glutaredoxin 2
VLWRAAIVLAIFTAGFMLQNILQRSDLVSERDKEKMYQEIPELQEASMYYTSLIDEKIRQIEPLLRENPELGKTLQQDLAELDSIYTELQNDLRDNIANDEVVEAMIQNYILKIQILEDLLDYMDKTSKNNEDENSAYDI